MADRSYLYVYYLFEGAWQGWAHTQNFSEIRLKCMQTLLATKGWDLFDVQLLLDIPLIPRTNDGWLYRERRQLNFASTKKFNKVDGISFDTESGQVQFSFQPVTLKSGEAMFDSNDVIEVFQRGLTSCFFTLNQPDNNFHAHPFQEMLYYPSSLLYTQYCATLLHTDYLLKMFTSGTEVCAKPPFEMRPISGSFFERLPVHLQQKLKPLHDRERNFSFGRAHRFWIEADEVIYERKLVGNQIQYRVDDVRLRVRKHLLIRDAEGKLVDDEEANESEEEKCSAESQFAKAFTDHYDETGSYFPELLRLKELLKLSALYIFARSRYEHLKAPVNPYPIQCHLAELRTKIDYPQTTDEQIDRYYNMALSKSDISSWNISSYEEQSARSMIRSKLEEVDQNIIGDAVVSICSQAHIPISSIARLYVKAWLDYQLGGTEKLARFIANGLTARDYALMGPIEQLKIRVSENEEKYDRMKHADDTCNWVPAVFLNKTGSGMHVYGGVNLQLKLTEGQVPINSMSSRYDAADIFAGQTNVSSTGPRNQQEYQTMKHNLSVAAASSSGSCQGDLPNEGTSIGSRSSVGASSGNGNGRKAPYDVGNLTGKESNDSNNDVSNFVGGSYTIVTPINKVTLYRLYGGKAGKVGQYWTLEEREGNWGTRHDLALLDEWNSVKFSTKIDIPEGVYFIVGRVAAQKGALGGSFQAFIPSSQ
ncbi:unnamed protein product [Rotaria sordida]|uniref:Uncharacterized protein n=1 Tax=Rotaria sordida TaxID=392033 RepID=A0A815BHX0_9BILA|nr:unnamed protein product [Rotaria sordida]